MIELFYTTSTNVYKILVALEEMNLAYRITPIDISAGEHRDPAKVGGSPTGKLPVIRDEDPIGGGESLTVFESGAILQYLAEKSGKFLPSAARERFEVMQWLFWQVGNLGPAFGQSWHFINFAPRIAPDVDNSYAYSRYANMVTGLWEVMERHLADRAFLAGDYSIADIAAYPWVSYFDPKEGREAYPNVARWIYVIAERPAVKKAYALIAEQKTGYVFDKERNVTIYPWEGVMKNVFVL